jgi:hypothetical protein
MTVIYIYIHKYIFPGAGGAVHDEVGHVADEVPGEPQVEEHVDGGEGHLPGVDGVHVAVADGGERGDGPVHRRDVPVPEALVLEVRHAGAQPRVGRVRVPVGERVVEAPRAVHREQRHLHAAKIVVAE